MEVEIRHICDLFFPSFKMIIISESETPRTSQIEAIYDQVRDMMNNQNRRYSSILTELQATEIHPLGKCFTKVNGCIWMYTSVHLLKIVSVNMLSRNIFGHIY